MYQNQLLAARILDATLSGHNLTDVMSSEAAHITAFSELYRDHPFIRVPAVVPEASGHCTVNGEI